MIIEDFLNDIEASEPLIIINYQDKYACTNGEYIEFSDNKYYNFRNGLNLYDSDYKVDQKCNLINIFQFFDIILYVCLDRRIIGCNLYDDNHFAHIKMD